MNDGRHAAGGLRRSNLYHHPANMFVAGFIGSPPMNFLEAKLAACGTDVLVDFGEFRFALPAHYAAQAQSAVGQEVIFGIRPEDIFDRTIAPLRLANSPHTASALVNVTEPLGANVLAYLKLGARDMIASFDSKTTAHAGDQLEVVFDMEHSHLFARENEQAFFVNALPTPVAQPA